MSWLSTTFLVPRSRGVLDTIPETSMRVIVKSEQCRDHNETTQATRAIVERWAQELSVPLESIDRIVVASEQTYGQSIREIDEREGFTSDGVNTGLGKTVPLPSANGQIRSAVVLREEVVFVCDAPIPTSNLYPPNGLWLSCGANGYCG